MRKYLLLFLTTGWLSVLILKNAYAQTGADATPAIALNNAEEYFKKRIGAESGFYNGPQYFFYNPATLRGSPYFGETTFTGNVYYDGVEYKAVQLIYDLYKDALVTVLFKNNTYFSLLKEGVQNFDLPGHHFININTDTLNKNTVLKSGYYDELYHGPTAILERVQITVEEVTSAIGTLEAFSTFTKPTHSFFIKKNFVYYKISGEGGMLDVLKDKKKLLRAYIKANKINFRKSPGEAMADVAAYYDSSFN